jgi:adenylate cyclase
MAGEPAALSVRDQMVDNQKVIDRLNAELARKTDEVRIIQQISTEISATLDLERILAISLDAMETVLGFRHCMILLADTEERVLTVAASRGYDGGGGAAPRAEIPVGQGVLGVAARRRRVVRIGNVGAQRAYFAGVRARMEAAEPSALRPSAEMPGLVDAQSQLGIPLVVKNRLVGVLGVESAAANAFDELDEMLLSVVGSQVATGIDNARLHLDVIEQSSKLNAANAELLRLNETLEARVGERTTELSAALDEVRREKELTESLLHRMAPPGLIPLMVEDKLLARRLDVTVMFSDLVDFTAYTSGLEPDEVFSQLNEFFGWAGEIIVRYRGYINKTNGDGIMALFGVPFESATHRTDAVLTALEMQREIGTRFPFGMRVGINAGTVTAGMLGPPDKSLYDVLGDVVNIASRVEALCPPGGVAVSPSCEDVLKPWFQIDIREEQEVKGVGRMASLNVLGLKSIAEDARRVAPTSRFAVHYLQLVEEVVAFKRDRLAMIDFVSLQARDLALLHNEAVASFALALLRMLRAGAAAAPRWSNVDEGALITAALLHDVGKHAVEPARLNEYGVDSERRERLRADLLDGTLKTLQQIGEDTSAAPITDLYRFEATRGAEGEFSPEVELLVAADIYDALTSPKIYKGSPWRIVGALAELMRLPYCQRQPRPVFAAFVELMKPADALIPTRGRPDIVIR